MDNAPIIALKFVLLLAVFLEALPSRNSIHCAVAAPSNHLICHEALKVDSALDPTITEYFMEHEVSERDAKVVVLNYTKEEIESSSPVWCDPCTKEIRRYCFSLDLLHDHCCCEQRHGKEKLPFIPHTCYVGEAECTPKAKTCADYDDRRSCCCEPLLKKHYRAIYAGAAHQTNHMSLRAMSTIALIAQIYFQKTIVSIS